MRPINRIIIHCTATPEGRDVTISEVRKWHIVRGWRDVGYHFLIRLDGTVETGRPIEQAGAHVKGFNSDSIGIAYAGGCDAKMKPKDTRTVEQKCALRDLVGKLERQFPNATVHGHNEFDKGKACPSFDVVTEL
jgi:N-acetylmuramoyl-L-alanine amidase